MGDFDRGGNLLPLSISRQTKSAAEPDLRRRIAGSSAIGEKHVDGLRLGVSENLKSLLQRPPELKRPQRPPVLLDLSGLALEDPFLGLTTMGTEGVPEALLELGPVDLLRLGV